MHIHFHLSSSTCRSASQQQQSREMGECLHLFSSCTLSFHGVSCHSSVYFIFLSLQKLILAITINRKTTWDKDSSFLSSHHQYFKMFHTSTSKAVNLFFICIMYVNLYIFLPFCAWPAHFACSFPAIEGMNREQHHALPKQCSAQLQA